MSDRKNSVAIPQQNAEEFKFDTNGNNDVAGQQSNEPMSFTERYCSIITLGIFILIALILIALASYYIIILPRVNIGIKPVPKDEFVSIYNIDEMKLKPDESLNKNDTEQQKVKINKLAEMLKYMKKKQVSFLILNSAKMFGSIDTMKTYENEFNLFLIKSNKIGVSISVLVEETKINDEYISALNKFEIVGVFQKFTKAKFTYDNIKGSKIKKLITETKLHNYKKSYNIMFDYDVANPIPLKKLDVGSIFSTFTYQDVFKIYLDPIVISFIDCIDRSLCFRNVIKQLFSTPIIAFNLNQIEHLFEEIPSDNQDTKELFRILSVATNFKSFKTDYHKVWKVDATNPQFTNISCKNDAQSTVEYCDFSFSNISESGTGDNFDTFVLFQNSRKASFAPVGIFNNKVVSILWYDQFIEGAKELSVKIVGKNYNFSKNIELGDNSSIIFGVYKDQTQFKSGDSSILNAIPTK